MCLKLDTDYKEVTQRYKNRKKNITVYKVLIPGKLSLYQKTPWKHGWNTSSRLDVKMTPLEKRKCEVGKGFHFFTNKRAAKTECSWRWNKPKVYECEVRPEDIVAVGRFCDKKSLVATKAKLLRQVKKF
jgi:hypothetical protein